VLTPITTDGNVLPEKSGNGVHTSGVVEIGGQRFSSNSKPKLQSGMLMQR